MKNSTSPRGRILFLAQAAAIAALYAGLTLATPMLSYGSIQFRFAEALTLLPALTPAAIPGLAVGCLLANLGSPYGLIDIVFGTLATLLAAICTWLLRKIQWKGLPLLSVLMPALFNGVIIGALLYFVLGFPFIASAISVAAGEAVAVAAGVLAMRLIVSHQRLNALVIE